MLRFAWLFCLTLLLAPLARAQDNTRQADLRGVIFKLNGSLKFLGRIDATSSAKDNTNCTTPFTIPLGATILISTDAAVRYLPGDSAASGTIVTTGGANTGVPLKADEKLITILKTHQKWVQARTASSTANVDFWLVE